MMSEERGEETEVQAKSTKRATRKVQEGKRRIAVFIERESHLGYRAYRAEIVGAEVIKTEPLHNSPDLESIAVNIAIQELEGFISIASIAGDSE